MAKVEVVLRPREAPQRDQLGEGAFWDAQTSCLYWVDIVGRRVMRLDPSSGAVTTWPTPLSCSSAIPTVHGDVIVALQDGLYRLDLETGAVRLFCRPDTDPRTRSNDCRTDPQGRIWLGTMWNNIGPDGQGLKIGGSVGGLFCVRADGIATRMLSHIGISNIAAVSPDGTRFYTADSLLGVIWSFAHEPDGPTLSDRRVFADEIEGAPDGSAMDEAGCLWTAQWGAGKVVRRTPQGRVDREIVLPVAQPSSCCFGGSDRKTLYITSARQELAGLAPEALDGALFQTPVDVPGLPMARFGG